MANIVILSGKITSEVDIKQVGKKNTTLAKFPFEHEEGQEYTVISWGKKAESLDMINRSNTLLITGKLEINKWTPKDGDEIKEFQIVAESIEILS